MNRYDPSGLDDSPPPGFSWNPIVEPFMAMFLGVGGGSGPQRPKSDSDRPGGGGGGDYFFDPFGLFAAEQTSFEALQGKDCAALFSGADPIKVLTDLYLGNVGLGSITWDNLGPPSAGSVTAAETKGILGRTPQGASMFTGATITINDNLSAPWFGGYPDKYNIGNPQSASTQNIYRAMTLIHELGHVFNIVTGLGSSTIVTPDPGSLSGGNTDKVFEDCFKPPIVGGHP